MNRTDLLLQHKLLVPVAGELAGLDLLLQDLDLGFLVDEFLVVGDLLLEQAKDGAGGNRELRRGRHLEVLFCSSRGGDQIAVARK